MTKALQRKAIYVATIVAMVAVVGGFAMAAGGVFGPIGGSNTQNGWTVSAAGTPWAGTVSFSPYVSSGAQVCSTFPYQAGGTGTPTMYISGDLAGTSLQCGLAGDFYEEFVFTPTGAPLGLSTADTFEFSSNLGSSQGLITTSASDTTTSLTVYVDYTTTGGVMTIPSSLTVLVF